MANKLTVKQQHFANLVLTGKPYTEAYAEAYPQSSLSRMALQVEASRLAAHPKVEEYIDAAKAARRKETLLTRDKKRQILGGIALDGRAPDGSRIMAIKVDNEMTGDNAPVRVQGEITLHTVFESLGLSTGLPDEAEVRQIKNVTPKKRGLMAAVDQVLGVPQRTAMEA